MLKKSLVLFTATFFAFFLLPKGIYALSSCRNTSVFPSKCISYVQPPLSKQSESDSKLFTSIEESLSQISPSAQVLGVNTGFNALNEDTGSNTSDRKNNSSDQNTNHIAHVNDEQREISDIPSGEDDTQENDQNNEDDQIDTDASNSSRLEKDMPSERKKPIREVKGVKKEYVYTGRVAYDEFYFTKVRIEPEIESEKGIFLKNGDVVRVIKKDPDEEVEGWYYVEIFKSDDEERIGEGGWIESWLIDDENTPEKPSPTPTQILNNTSEANKSDDFIILSPMAEAMFDRINEHRANIGLNAYQKHPEVCKIAKERIPEIHNEIFGPNYIHQGMDERNIDYWITENAVGMGSLEANFNWWMNSSIHKQAIESEQHIYSCGECLNGSCIQLFTSFQPK